MYRKTPARMRLARSPRDPGEVVVDVVVGSGKLVVAMSIAPSRASAWAGSARQVANVSPTFHGTRRCSSAGVPTFAFVCVVDDGRHRWRRAKPLRRWAMRGGLACGNALLCGHLEHCLGRSRAWGKSPTRGKSPR